MSNPKRPSPERPIDGTEPTAISVVWQYVWVRAVSFVVLTLFILVVLWRFRHGYAFALQVGLIGFLIAYILHPLVDWLNRRLRFKRPFAVIFTYTLLLLLFVFGSVVISQVVLETGRFINLIPAAMEKVTDAVLGLQNSLAELAARLPDFLSNRFGVADESGAVATQIQDQLATFLQQLLVGLKNLLESIISGGPGLLLTGATAVISTTFQIFLILLAGAYFLYDFPRFVANFKRFVPVRYRTISDDMIRKADLAVGGYLRGQLVITMMLGVMIWIGLILIGIPLATAISFLAAVFNLIPYLGPILGVIPAILLGFTVSPLAALLAALVFLIANQLEAHVLSPLILSRNTNLHPVTVMLAIMAGIGLMGLLGALLAVPLVALVKVVLEDYLLARPAFTGVPRRLPKGVREIGPRRKDERF